MHALMRRFALVAGLLMLSMASGCAARSRMGAATIQPDVSGQPCFGIENTPATRSGGPVLESVTVSTQGGGQVASRPVWSFMIEPRRSGMPLMNAQCISYGRTPKGMRLLTESSPLEPGVVYVVSMGVRLADPDDSTQAYQGRFCLIPGSPKPGVYEVLWDARAGQWMTAPCSAKPATKP
jgi:hypothetical protein